MCPIITENETSRMYMSSFHIELVHVPFGLPWKMRPSYLVTTLLRSTAQSSQGFTNICPLHMVVLRLWWAKADYTYTVHVVIANAKSTSYHALIRMLLGNINLHLKWQNYQTINSTLGTLSSLLQLKRFKKRQEHIALYPGSFPLVLNTRKYAWVPFLLKQKLGYAWVWCYPVFAW